MSSSYVNVHTSVVHAIDVHILWVIVYVVGTRLEGVGGKGRQVVLMYAHKTGGRMFVWYDMR